MKKHVFIKCAAACLLLAAAFSALGGCSSENTDTPAVIIFAGDPQSAPETRYDYSAWAGILEQAAETAPDSNYLVIGGDLVNEYSDPEEWSAFFSFGGERLEHFGEKVFPVPGNHTSDEDTTREYFELPKSGCPDGLFYSFDAGDIHFIMLDSIAMGTRDAQAVSRITEWIRGDLESSEGKWNIAVMHHPMFPMADSRKDRIRADTMCKNYLPVLTDGGVCALLCGHEHAYSRVTREGLLQIMSASGGKLYELPEEAPADLAYWEAPVFTVISAGEDGLIFETYDTGGALIDSVTVDAGRES